jgi:hypothetical protein
MSKELSRTPQRSPRRPYSSASPKPRRPEAPTVAKTSIAPTYELSPSAANPPPTTRPPPLDLPDGPPDAPVLSQPYFSYLFATGKAYLKFYKTGIKHIYTNTRLLYSSSSDPELAAARPERGTRADMHLHLRWRYDVRRLPLFALMLIICGEFTPLVVLALPGAVPLPCRIPKQVDKLLLRAERRRMQARIEQARHAVEFGSGAGPAPSMKDMFVHYAQVLGLSAPKWMPAVWIGSGVLARFDYLAADDELLIKAGGAAALVPEEVRLACVDRGIQVLGRGDEELRRVLDKWLRLTDERRLGKDGRKKAVMFYLSFLDKDWDRAKKAPVA